MARGTIINSGNGAIGDIQASMLSLSEFQDENGLDWVLADGLTDISTSRYGVLKTLSVPPDLRGQFLRGKNNGRSTATGNAEADLAVGTQRVDQNDAHSHVNAGYFNDTPNAASLLGLFTHNNGIPRNHTSNSSGGNEVRARNITVNYFIKVN